MSTSKAGIFFFTASENLENSVLAFSFNTCDFWICCRVCQITGRHYFYSILHLICLIFQESEWKFFYKNLFIYIAKMSWRLIISDVDTRFIDSFRFFNIWYNITISAISCLTFIAVYSTQTKNLNLWTLSLRRSLNFCISHAIFNATEQCTDVFHVLRNTIQM